MGPDSLRKTKRLGNHDNVENERGCKRTSGPIRSYRPSTEDTSTLALLDHLFRGEDVGVDEAEEVDADFILDEPEREKTSVASY